MFPGNWSIQNLTPTLKVLGHIAADQAKADDNAHWAALSVGVSQGTRPDELSELADAVRRLITVRPDLAHGTTDLRWPLSGSPQAMT